MNVSWLGIATVALSVSALAAPPADQRIKAQLDSLGYKYDMTSDNDYKLVPLQIEQTGTKADGTAIWRTQLVYVDSNTEKYGSLEIREVLAPAYLGDCPISASISDRLLHDNNTLKFGAWRSVDVKTGQNAGKCLAMFAAQIPANADAETLRSTIKDVATVADKTEKELTGTDDY